MTESLGSIVITPDPLDSFDGGDGRVVTNLISNPSFEVDLTGWTAVNGAIAQDDGTFGASAIAGGFLMRVEGTGGGFSAVTPAGTSGMPVTARSHYRILVTTMFFLGSDTYNQQPSVIAAWYNAAGTLFGGGVVAADVTPDVQVPITAEVIAPAGAAYLQVQLIADSVGPAAFVVDAVMVTQGAELLTYFDGDTADTSTYRYDWTSLPHASTSTRTLL